MKTTKEIDAVKDLYWELVRRYTHVEFANVSFEIDYVDQICPLRKFISNCDRKLSEGNFEDLDIPSVNTVLEELFEMEKGINKLETDASVYRQRGLLD